MSSRHSTRCYHKLVHQKDTSEQMGSGISAGASEIGEGEGTAHRVLYEMLISNACVNKLSLPARPIFFVGYPATLGIHQVRDMPFGVECDNPSKVILCYRTIATVAACVV
jgi:hypothetical protein